MRTCLEESQLHGGDSGNVRAYAYVQQLSLLHHRPDDPGTGSEGALPVTLSWKSHIPVAPFGCWLVGGGWAEIAARNGRDHHAQDRVES